MVRVSEEYDESIDGIPCECWNSTIPMKSVLMYKSVKGIGWSVSEKYDDIVRGI